MCALKSSFLKKSFAQVYIMYHFLKSWGAFLNHTPDIIILKVVL